MSQTLQTKLYEFEPPADSEFAKNYPDIAKELICIGEGTIKDNKFTGKMRDKRTDKFDDNIVKLKKGDCAWGYAYGNCYYGDGYNITVGVIALPVANVKELGLSKNSQTTETANSNPSPAKKKKLTKCNSISL
jgi:hypothetical protein